MALLQDIEQYAIHSSTLSKDKQFLETIGNKLRRATKDEIKPELIHAVAELLNDFFIKLDDEGKLNDNMEKTLIELRGVAYALEQMIDDKRLYDEYFTKALELGSKILKFAQALRFLLVGAIADNIPPSLFG